MHRIYTFESISESLRFEKILKGAGIKVKLMPVPRALSSSCGTCAKVDSVDYSEVDQVVEENRLAFDQKFDIE